MIYKTAGASKSLIVVRAADTLHKIQFRFQTLSSEVFGLGERRNIFMYVLAWETWCPPPPPPPPYEVHFLYKQPSALELVEMLSYGEWANYRIWTKIRVEIPLPTNKIINIFTLLVIWQRHVTHSLTPLSLWNSATFLRE